MATIQVRNVPEDVHRTYRVRAAAAGKSLQEFLRDELIRNARLRSPAEIVAEVEAQMAREGVDGYSAVSAVESLRADRASH